MAKEIIPKDSRYVPLTQQRFCCVPTCIQVVMLRHGMPLISAELMGYHMGLLVPKEDRGLFWNAKTGPRPATGYGVRLGRKGYEPNAVLRKLGIPLKINLIPIGKFKDLKRADVYLEELSKTDKDIVVCFDSGVLFGGRERQGHVCVVDKIYPEQKELRIIDPGSRVPKWRTVKIEKLFKAMKFHDKGSKMAGFWEIIPTNRNKDK